MKRPQLIGLAIASTAGIAAFMMVSSLTNRPPEPAETVEVKVKTSRILVASADIPLGRVTSSGDYRWQDWPEENLTADFVTEAKNPNAASEFGGMVARLPLMAGEPVSNKKLVKAGQGGVLAVLVGHGMRAISTKIQEDTAVANLVLPNDRVDVIVTKRGVNRFGKEQFESAILFGNVRVLAIGQQIESPDGKTAVVQGTTATLELTPGQAEQLALANMAGEISLALRPLVDMSADAKPEDKSRAQESSGSVQLFRYGSSSRVYGVN